MPPVQAWLARAAAARPRHPAINDITYEVLYERARCAAGGLRDAGARRGDRVGIQLPPGEDFAVLLHACLLLGAVADPAADDGWSEVPRGAALTEPFSHDLDAPAITVRTSGTTSRPKQVDLTYGNWLWSALGSAATLGHPRSERWLSALPLTHVGGLSILMRSVIGATTAIVHERWDTAAVLDRLERDDVTIVSLVPTTLQRLLDAGWSDPPPAFRTALLGGAPISDALLERARAAGIPVTATYGLTEACSQVLTNGVPLFCTRVELDAADGEIVVSGPTVSGAQPLRTGDLGRTNADGTISIVGRKADTIITGGENVAPAEVEAVLEAHPAVREAAVLGEEDPEWGERVVAQVVLEPDVEITPDELREHALGRLDRFKVPKAIRLREKPLPRTPSGKLLRRELP